MQLALMNRRILMTVKKLDRILNRDDMVVLGFIDQINDGCESGALAAAGGTSHQYDTGLHIDNFAQLLRQTKVFEARRPRRDHPHHNCMSAALSEDVNAKSIDPRKAKRNIDRAQSLEVFRRLGVVANYDLG